MSQLVSSVVHVTSPPLRHLLRRGSRHPRTAGYSSWAPAPVVGCSCNSIRLATSSKKMRSAAIVVRAGAEEELQQPPRAAFLAIGTANQANCVPQDEYADYYFRITKSEHLTRLKNKMKRICDNSAIKKRYFHHTEDLIRDNPEFVDQTAASLDARLNITAAAVPELAAVASAKAIDEWGRPATDITHLVVGTYSCASMPGPDLRLTSLLGLRPSVQRTMLYYHGCSSGVSALRVAKDIAENNRGARVLVVCTEVTLVGVCAPDEVNIDTLVVQALFGDGAAAVIVGADPQSHVERPIFEVLSASQTTIPGSEKATSVQLSKVGMDYHLSSEMPALVHDNVQQCLVDALAPLGITNGGWSSLFWAVHPGGHAIVDRVGEALSLEPEKLAATRRVLSEYGNMSGATILFVLDELRRRHRDAKSCEHGVMVAFGPGVTVEVMALRACLPTAPEEKAFHDWSFCLGPDWPEDHQAMGTFSDGLNLNCP